MQTQLKPPNVAAALDANAHGGAWRAWRSESTTGLHPPIFRLVLWALSFGTQAQVLLFHLLKRFELFPEARVPKDLVCLLVELLHPGLD
jgi:hypothetical protein